LVTNAAAGLDLGVRKRLFHRAQKFRHMRPKSNCTIPASICTLWPASHNLQATKRQSVDSERGHQSHQDGEGENEARVQEYQVHHGPAVRSDNSIFVGRLRSNIGARIKPGRASAERACRATAANDKYAAGPGRRDGRAV
jgi:hypothetical protein